MLKYFGLVQVIQRKPIRIFRILVLSLSDSKKYISCGYRFPAHHSSSAGKMSDSGESTWRGVPVTQIYGAQSPWGAPEFPLIKPSSNHTVLYHIPSDGVLSNLPPKPQVSKDAWDQYHVRLPCSIQSLYPVKNESGEVHLKKRWRLIENALSKPIRNSQELMDTILSYNTKFKDRWKFRVLHKLFNKYLEEEETKYFFDVTLPAIVKLALDLPKLIQAPIPLLKQHKNHSVSLSQQQISSILANAFFCTFPRRNSTKKDSEYDTYPSINFSRLYESSASRDVLEKMKCICHYFRRVTTKVPTGVVTFSRRSVPPRLCPPWGTCGRPLAALPVHADSERVIEHAHGLIQVDFANRFLGGGVLGHGCVQEEIRFIICPDLIASMLFCEEMRPNEAVMVIGVEQYSSYSGYSNKFEWAGDYHDRSPLDSSYRRRCAVLAIDAVSYSRHVDTQYEREKIVRELNKAWVGFSFYTNPDESPDPDDRDNLMNYPGIATGNWGCGVYRGSPYLKSLLQMMACAVARRPMAYYTFGDERLRDDIVNMHNLLSRHNVTVGQLYNYILQYCESERSQPLQIFLKQVLEEADVETVPASEPMDVSYTSDVEVVSTEQRTGDNESPDLFSQDNSDQDTQVTKVPFFTNTETNKSSQETDNTAETLYKLADTGSKMVDAGVKMADAGVKMADAGVKMADAGFKMAENRSLLDGDDIESQKSERHTNESEKSTKESPVSNTTRLFEEMEKLDESNGKLNFNTTNSSFLDVNTSQNSLTDNNEHKIQIELSSETKKKLSGKITDYFSKKRS